MAKRLVRWLSSDEIIAWALGVGVVILVIGSITCHIMARPSESLDQHIGLVLGGLLGFMARALSPVAPDPPVQPPARTAARRASEGDA